VIRDITHIREIETLKSQAIQTASHDIRTPLSGVRNALDLLMKVSPDLSEQQATLIEMAMVSVERVQTMAKGLLNIEQIESGIALNEAVNLSEVLRRAVDEAGGVAGGREVTLEIEVSDSLAPVAGSSIWLERAVANYLSNAVRYAPRGSAVLTRLFTEGGEVRLEVSDTGPGIPVEMQDRVFERFFRGAEPPDNDLPPGSGLGLAIVKRVVEAHNGRVYVRSRSGDGATFGFGIPEARYE
jgi:signal transduction histidine kinase